jgi:EAL domain-containing protein (putative c-di-GMP-specific phosphodiesterase class I)
MFCFELQQADICSHAAESAAFVALLKPAGCRFAIAGFDGKQIPPELLAALKVDFVKIDAGLILNILRHPADLARVKAIHAVVSEIGIRTIAECVEDDATAGKLHALGINFAQGFGIARPRPLGEPAPVVPNPQLAHAA